MSDFRQNILLTRGKVSYVPPDLDHGACYQAISKRDARFDGRFFTAVTSTGIFCRPSCPARTPKSTNVRFFAHAAAASEAGFRPCRRCRPELAPGHPEWNRRADLAGRAVRLIQQGVVDRDGVVGLAAQLGVSQRHLRRELKQELGTGPIQLAQTRRLSLARLLLDQTNLSITDIAFASGFNSIRQFNDGFRSAFRATPTDLRRRPDAAPTGKTDLTITLPCRGPVRWTDLHRFLSTRAIRGLESANETGFRRGVPGGQVELRGTEDDDRLTIRCSLDRLDRLADLVGLVRSVADLDTDLEPIAAHLATDPELSRRLDRRPLPRLPGAFDRFEVAIRAIIGQQVSVAAACTTLSKLVTLATGTEPKESPTGAETAGAETGAEGHRPIVHHGFPTAAQVANAPLEQLGVPGRRRQTVRAIAEAVAEGRIDLGPAAEIDEQIPALLEIPGIGPWTAGYIAMRALSNPDGWPSGDLVLRQSFGDVTVTDLDCRAEGWQPWRAYAALLLWATSDLDPA